ncbi:hypothetical protein MA615_000604 [Vibrio vulnificus]|nr:hypothetical protein [Vibrio vulnificus]EIV8619466.1 hypothetical protein [Vibrio vulnificus]ELQ2523870.1 hypothetical protein [Vibrio vulnificus]EME0097477.1 hypothetical protein [Vibrio vulnificus]
MDNFDDGIKNAIEAGQHNLETLELLANWCEHAEFSRSGGVGIVEAETGLPIGHMGMQCKYSKQSSLYCWLLEDSVYDFYKSTCVNCDKRVPVSIPNILKFVEPRLKADEKRKQEKIKAAALKKEAQTDRKLQRAELRPTLTLEETFVIDLLDELDVDDVSSSDPRLEKFAHLAPEVFTPSIVEILIESIEGEHLPYSHQAAQALINAPIGNDVKLPVAMYLFKQQIMPHEAIVVTLNAINDLTLAQLQVTLRAFVTMAVERPPSIHLYQTTALNSEPLKRLFSAKKNEINGLLKTFFKESNLVKTQTALEVLVGLNDKDLFSLYVRDIIGLLMRRRLLLPDERRESSIIYYLREAATLCLSAKPELTDRVIQAYLKDKDPVGVDESNQIYKSILRPIRSETKVSEAHKLSFKRLLWAAVDNPDDHRNGAIDVFRHASHDYSELAHENFDDLIGASATLTEKYEDIDRKSTIELSKTFLDEIERDNKKSSIRSLQSSLINLAAYGAKYRGSKGIQDFLTLYRKLPKNQEQMRGCMITHISKMVTGVASLNLVLSDWYGALLDESVVVRASAVEAWEDVPFETVKNFPDLFFETFSLAFKDPYVMVHKRAVRALRFRSFPENKRSLIKIALWNLILIYNQEGNDDDFIVDCIDLLVSLCMTDEEIQGVQGRKLSNILLKLDGSALYHVINRAGYRLKQIPNFSKVALKAIQDIYTRQISIEDCQDIILSSSKKDLKNNITDIVKALSALKPFHPSNFRESLTYARALSVSEHNALGADLFRDFVDTIPDEERSLLFRIQTDIVATALQIENEIQTGSLTTSSILKWHDLIDRLEKESEERSQLRDFPPSFNC